MIEVYRNTSERVPHTVYYSGAPVDVDNDLVNVEIYSPDTGERWYVTAESLNLGRYQIRLPGAATQYDGLLKTYWRYTYQGEAVVEEEDISVVTPYVTLDEITTAYPELYNKTYDELKFMERRVRLMINQITGQEFGLRTKALELSGEGEMFSLPEKLFHVHYFSIDGQQIHNHGDHLQVINDGWAIQVTYPPGWYHIKSDVLYGRKKNSHTVVLHGNFGWPIVPNDINMAATMLIGDYFCSDAVYRQRGVQAVRAADWRLDFHDKAFTGTGNLDVDLLLSKYKAYNMVII